MSKKAQDMIQKGIESGDMELVKQGHALLSKKPKKKAVANKTIKKRGRPTKKKLTQPVSDDILTEEQEEKDPYDFSFQTRQNPSKQTRGDGRKAPRVEQVDFSNQKNVFVDDGTLIPVREAEKKLYIVPPIPRRESLDIRMIPCSECENEFAVNVKTVKHKKFMCDSCMKDYAVKLKKRGR